MAKKKFFEISNSLAQALEETISAAKNYSGDLNIDVVPLTKIDLDPENPREMVLTFNDLYNEISKDDADYARKIIEKENLKTLADSIQKQGVLNPIIVYKFGDKYRLIAGERRTLASVLCNKESIQARVLEGRPSKLTLGLLQWIENVERVDLSLWERLKNIEKIVVAITEEKKKSSLKEITASDIGEVVGCSIQLATNYKSVLDASPELKGLIQKNEIRNLEKAALISRSPIGIQNELMNACLHGASLKKLKHLSEIKEIRIKPQEQRGRKPSCINFGTTKNPLVAKFIIESILENKKLNQLKLSNIKWDNPSDLSNVFKELIKNIEQQIKIGP